MKIFFTIVILISLICLVSSYCHDIKYNCYGESGEYVGCICVQACGPFCHPCDIQDERETLERCKKVNPNAKHSERTHFHCGDIVKCPY